MACPGVFPACPVEMLSTLGPKTKGWFSSKYSQFASTACIGVINYDSPASGTSQDGRTELEVTRDTRQDGYQMGGAKDGNKSGGGSVKYQTCLMFCRSTVTSRLGTLGADITTE